MESIKEWQSPILVKGVRLFLRLVNFYKKFIKNFSALTESVINILKKKDHLSGRVNNKRHSTS